MNPLELLGSLLNGLIGLPSRLLGGLGGLLDGSPGFQPRRRARKQGRSRSPDVGTQDAVSEKRREPGLDVDFGSAFGCSGGT